MALSKSGPRASSPSLPRPGSAGSSQEMAPYPRDGAGGEAGPPWAAWKGGSQRTSPTPRRRRPAGPEKLSGLAAPRSPGSKDFPGGRVWGADSQVGTGENPGRGEEQTALAKARNRAKTLGQITEALGKKPRVQPHTGTLGVTESFNQGLQETAQTCANPPMGATIALPQPSSYS